MVKQKIRRLEEVDRPFTKEEKKWIIKNLIGTIVVGGAVILFYGYFLSIAIERYFF